MQIVTSLAARPDPERQLASPNRAVHVCILLLLRKEPAHGYALLQQLCELGAMGPNRARIYRALRWLEDAGFVTCWWDTPAVGAARRMYELCPAGASALAAVLPRLTAGETTPEDHVSQLILTLAEQSRAS